MSSQKRKVLYLSLMPFLFCVNILINFIGLNTTILLAAIAIFFVIMHVSDRGEHFLRLNETLKRKLVRLYPDIYQTGLMPTGRLLLGVIPIILAMLLNIPISNAR